MITKIKVKKRSLFCLCLECINNHIAKEEKVIEMLKIPVDQRKMKHI